MTTDDDTRLLDDLRDLWSRTDPPPAGLSAAMIAAVAYARRGVHAAMTVDTPPRSAEANAATST